MRYRKCVLAFVLVAASTSTAFGQEWTAEQLEVWRNVETYWDLYMNEETEAFLTYMHDDFLGWIGGEPYPTNKADRKASLLRAFANTDRVWKTLKPVGIRIFGEVAIVHYFFTVSYVDLEDDQTTESGAWTDILMRQGDKWVMIADAGGAPGGN